MWSGFGQLRAGYLAVATKAQVHDIERHLRRGAAHDANQDLPLHVHQHTNSPNTQICCCASKELCISGQGRKSQYRIHSSWHVRCMRQEDVAKKEREKENNMSLKDTPFLSQTHMMTYRS
jgi:hypothetical protein